MGAQRWARVKGAWLHDRNRASLPEGDVSMFRRDEPDATWGGPSNPENTRGPLSGRMQPAGSGGGGFGAAPSVPPRTGGNSGGNGGGNGFGEPPRGPAQSPSAAASRDAGLFELKRKVQAALIAELDPKTDLSQTAAVRKQI